VYLGRRGERHLRFENNALLIAIVAAGIAAEWALVWSLGSAVIALNVIPVVVVSWKRGAVAGVLTTALISLNHAAVCYVVEGSLSPWLIDWGGLLGVLVITPLAVGVARHQRTIAAQVDALRRAEHMLVGTESRYRLAAEGANDGLWEWDMGTRAMQVVQMSASIGVVFAQGRRDASDLLRDADVAMYRAKAQGGGQAVLFDLALHAEVVRDRTLRHDLERALSTEAFEMRFQPLVLLESGRPVGFEGLARWTHPDLGSVPPGRFVPLAEEAGTIGALGNWALAEAIRRSRMIQQDAGLAPEGLYVAVNLSPREFRDDSLAMRIHSAIEAAQLEPHRLCLEITESALLEEPDRAVDVLRELRSAGVRIALDDFGTGYSSLSTLHRLPIDCLKIDGSFVQGLETDLDKRAIVESIIALGRRLDLLLVAEGIETQAQRERLREMGCTVGQGWLFGQAMPGDEVKPYLSRALL